MGSGGSDFAGVRAHFPRMAFGPDEVHGAIGPAHVFTFQIDNVSPASAQVPA